MAPTTKPPSAPLSRPVDFFDAVCIAGLRGEVPEGIIRAVLKIQRDELRKSDARLRGEEVL